MKKFLLLLIIPLLSFGQQELELRPNEKLFFLLLIIGIIWVALNIRFVNHLRHTGRYLIDSTKTKTLNAEIIKHAGSKLKSASSAYWVIIIFSIICFFITTIIIYLLPYIFI